VKPVRPDGDGPAPRRRLVVLTRWPAARRCKRRLAADLGAASASRIQAALGTHVLAAARQARQQLGYELVLASSGIGATATRRWAGQLSCDLGLVQGQGGLGVRLQRQLQRSWRAGANRVVLIGGDLPELESGDLLHAFHALEQTPLVLGPAVDGGYWLIGLRRNCPPLFCGIPWGGDQVLARTLAEAARQGLDWQYLRRQCDLDRAPDLARWR
jgi:rSAM/selenodomain-associated transferase 1